MNNNFLLVEYYENRLTPEKRKQVEEWISESYNNKNEYQEIIKIWESSKSLKVIENIDVQKEWELVLRKYDSRKKSLYKIKRFYKVAASIIIILGLSTVLYWQIGKYGYAEVINNKANQVKNIILSDGTEVFLNYKSKLTYPKEFKKNVRNVALQGQGYFKVKRDTEVPFYVKTRNGKVEVLGTSFTVKSLNEYTSVIVETGIVKLTNKKNNSVILEKGFNGEISLETISKKLNENKNYLAWKTGVFTFSDASLDQVFSNLSSKYHFQYQFSNNDLNERKLTASFNEEPLNDILKIIEISCQVKIERESNIIVIK